MAALTPDRPLPYAMKVRPDCAQLFILYTGMAGKLMIPPMQFIEATRIVDRNLIILRDLNKCCYQRGVSVDIPDIPQFLQWQSDTVNKLTHVREVYCIGSSGGAYAALLSGHWLKAVKVWAFAPPVPVRTSEWVPYVDSRFNDLSLVLKQSNEVSQYGLYYNHSEVPDREAAEKLQDAPGVTLFPQAGQGHGVVGQMAKNAQLTDLLPKFVGC